MKKLGIMGAMSEEVETLLERMQDKSASTKAGTTFYEGTLSGMAVVVVQCGIGKVNAAMCAQTLITCFAVTHIVNTGIAGSLNADLDIGDLLVSRDVMHHDFDCCAFGYPMGKVPGLDVVAFPADGELVSLAFAAAEELNPGHTMLGRVASGDQFVADKAKKEQIIATTGAFCTEMEGAAIAQTAYRNGIPFVILRAISDKADDSFQMDYPTFERIAAHRCAKVTMALAAALK